MALPDEPSNPQLAECILNCSFCADVPSSHDVPGELPNQNLDARFAPQAGVYVVYSQVLQPKRKIGWYASVYPVLSQILIVSMLLF